jgi:hypothetical protein
MQSIVRTERRKGYEGIHTNCVGDLFIGIWYFHIYSSADQRDACCTPAYFKKKGTGDEGK